MASIQSHGLHEPSALQYLIAEGILPPEHSPEAYTWRSYLSPDEDGPGLVQEEILIARECVVWSRCGIVKRVLHVDAEDGNILTAFTTSFETSSEANVSDNAPGGSKARREKALVVVLKSQAHLLVLSGDSHILPLPFEVQSAYPCPYGFIVQRKLSSDEKDAEETSFHHELSTINESQGTLRTDSNRPSLLLPNPTQALLGPGESKKGMPRTYSCTEIMSELGLVVCGSSSKPSALDDCPALPLDEEVLYISGHDELYTLSTAHATLCIAVSRNTTTGKIAVWHVARDVPLTSQTHSRKQKSTRKSETSLRKSSNIYGRNAGASTPVPRGPSRLRESYGGPVLLNAENLLYSSTTEQKSSATDDLAAQLGTGFGEVGVQTRSARRVSSMLARTDLGTGNDRGAFHDLAMGHGTRKSLNRPGPRGESIGSFGDRQSFGRRRSSFPATTSILSTETSFLDVPGQVRTSILDPGRGLDFLDSQENSEGGSHLPREVGFFKLTSFYMSDEGHVHKHARPFKVLSFPSPRKAGQQSRDLSVCVLDPRASLISIANVQVELSQNDSMTTVNKTPGMRLKATKLRRGSGIADACLVVDDTLVRLLILTKTRDGHTSIQLEAPWSPPLRVELPSSYCLSSPVKVSFGHSPSGRRNEDSRRTLSSTEVEVAGIDGRGGQGQLLLIGVQHRRHLLSIRLQPADSHVRDILCLSNWIFGSEYQDGLLVAYWEVIRWLNARLATNVTEWTAMVVTLCSLAVPFTEDKNTKSNTPSKRKKAGLLRSSSGTALEWTDFNAMRDAHTQSRQLASRGAAWAWLSHALDSNASPTRNPKHSRNLSAQPTVETPETNKSGLLLQCVSWAREFIQSPMGETAIGPEGYLPISINKDRNTRQTALAKLVVGLHLMNEEHRLNLTSEASSSWDLGLTAVLAQFGQWLGWEDWSMKPGSYYFNESTESDHWSLDDTKIRGLETPPQPFLPPSLFQHIAEHITREPDETFPTMELLLDQNADSRQAKDAMLELTPRTSLVLSFIRGLQKTTGPVSAADLVKANETEHPLTSTLPDGIAAVFFQAIASCKSQSKMSVLQKEDEKNSCAATLSLTPSHDANKDHHSVSIAALETENLQRWDASSEADRHTITRLIFQDDRRFQEASKTRQSDPPACGGVYARTSVE